MKKTLTILLLTMGLLFTVSCGSKKATTEPVSVTHYKEVEKIVRDTIVQTKADSVRTVVQIDCPDGAKPILTPALSKGEGAKRGRILLPPKLTLNGNQLTIDCKAEAEKLALQLYDKYVKEHKWEVIIQEVEKPFAWYHKTLMWVGGITLIALLLPLIVFLIKPKLFK